ncbi:hypothetical protein [Leadbettera azotonutricia]|nr:hypothetical protein [Leadbettera azotonutricia]
MTAEPKTRLSKAMTLGNRLYLGRLSEASRDIALLPRLPSEA